MSELRLRMGPTPCEWEWECVCRLDELMTEGPWRRGVMGVAAEVGGWGRPSGYTSLSRFNRAPLEARFNWREADAHTGRRGKDV